MSIREAMVRFEQLHKDFKAGAFKSPESRKFYESERDDFLRALLQAQQLAMRPGQSPRQALRVAATVPLTLHIGPRVETGTTADLASAGFCAIIGVPLALRILCDFELAGDEPLKGRARVVASTREGAGTYRTSFAIETMPDADRTRLEVAVVDVALAAIPRTR
jgi:hypothetical protein